MEDSVQTRPSLLRKVKDWQDQASWQEFYATYKPIIVALARKSGLTEAEAEDLAQETILEVAQKMPAFEYDPARGSFKGWLLRLTHWRILDHWRKHRSAPPASPEPEGGDRTRTVDRVPDVNAVTLDAMWEQEWAKGLLQKAMDNVRRQSDPEKFQIFDLYVTKEWPVDKVATTLGITPNQVYLAKHRITELIKAEVKRLETEPLTRPKP